MAFLEFSDKNRNKSSILLSHANITYLAGKDGTLTASENKSKEHQAGFFKSSRGWVILDYTGYFTFVNGVRVADCKLVQEGDRIQIGNIFAQLTEEIRKEIVPEGSRWLNSEVICYYDQCGFEIEDEIVCCPECGVPYHYDCWEELGERGERCVVCNYRILPFSSTRKES